MTPPCERLGCGDPSISRVPVYHADGMVYRLASVVEPVHGEVWLCALHEGELAVNGEVPLTREQVTA